MKLQIELRDLRKVLSEKCLEIFHDKKLAEALYWNIAEIEDDKRFTEVEDTGDKHTQWVHEPDRTNHWHCSGCGYVTGLAGLMCNFCPNCGAKVQKKTEAELRAEVSGG